MEQEDKYDKDVYQQKIKAKKNVRIDFFLPD